ncbi:hypothetical protein PYCC9005_005372 [Savitreella phatthalungensis]
MRGLKRPLLELSESEVNAHAPRQLNVSPLHKDDATPPVSRATQTHVPLVRRLLARRLLPASQNLISALDGMELHSRPQDILNRIWFKSPDADVVATPFAADCARTCSLSAIADEAGLVSIFDHEPAGEASWKPIVRFRTNRNAIFDIQWSLDDKGLAVATAEKSATIIDIPTATTTHRLRAHKSTVKTVRFHPSKASVVASAGRDGSIAIWDLRCRSGGAGKGCEGCDVPSLLIGSAHASGTKLDHASSITGLAFVSETALASASAQDDVVRTWDIRNARSDVKNRRRRPTDQSPKTSVVRQHGLTALCPSRDGARLFAISRDSRVHEYELISLSGGPSRTWQLPRTTISTFYCKAAVSKDDILCVGASDGKPTFSRTRMRWAWLALGRLRKPFVVLPAGTTANAPMLRGRTTTLLS